MVLGAAVFFVVLAATFCKQMKIHARQRIYLPLALYSSTIGRSGEQRLVRTCVLVVTLTLGAVLGFVAFFTAGFFLGLAGAFLAASLSL